MPKGCVHMPKVTKADLEIDLNRKRELIELQAQQIMALQQELEDTHNQLGVVSRSEFDFAIAAHENQKFLYSTLNNLYEKEKAKYYAQIKLNVEQRESFDQIIAELKTENESLCTRLNQPIERAEIKKEHNSRGAGRKPYENVEVIQRILSLHSTGVSYQLIADALNTDQLYTKSGKPWAKSSIRLILLKAIVNSTLED